MELSEQRYCDVGSSRRLTTKKTPQRTPKPEPTCLLSAVAFSLENVGCSPTLCSVLPPYFIWPRFWNASQGAASPVLPSAAAAAGANPSSIAGAGTGGAAAAAGHPLANGRDGWRGHYHAMHHVRDTDEMVSFWMRRSFVVLGEGEGVSSPGAFALAVFG